MAPGTVSLIGSGEFLDAMARVHRGLLAPLGSDVAAVFLDTPAGFELNLDAISERAVQYFAQRFEVGLGVVSYRSRAEPPAAVATALARLAGANYLVAGPGSPSYAVRAWQGSPIWEGVGERLAAGATVVLASAAAMASGRWTVPVYEIYRGGADPHWIEGLNLLAPYGLELAVIAHWNNTDGAGYDTRFCFLGEDRLEVLRRDLPAGVTILGIDEHTACNFDLANRRCTVAGIGSVTVIRGQDRVVHHSGSEFDFSELVHGGGAPRETAGADPTGGSPTIATRLLREVAGALEKPAGPDQVLELVGIAHTSLHELEGQPHDHADGAALAGAIELLQRARLELRSKKSFELADEIRDHLAQLGVQSADKPIQT